MTTSVGNELEWFERLPKVELHLHLEGAGPTSIWGAIRSLKLDRIGHGTRAAEDPQLVDFLADRKIPVELCVLSNVRTAVVPEVARHPARLYYDRGIPLSVNTDDPKLFGNSLAEEYLALHQFLGFTRSEIVSLIEQGIETSWLPDERKQQLRQEFRIEFTSLERTLQLPPKGPVAMNSMSDKPPSPIHEVFPYLCVRGAAAAIEFYIRVFGAEELFRIDEPGGRIGHAQLKLGPVTLMLADEHPEVGIRSPLAFGGTGTTLHLHVENVDSLARQAVEAGATILIGPVDQPHGERQCRLRDPFGHEWLLGHQIEDVSHDEMQRRYAERAISPE